MSSPSMSVSSRSIAVALAIVAVAALAAAPLAAQAAPALDPALFPVPRGLEPNVDFWIKVYTDCTSDQVLLHDNLHLGVVYALVDFARLDASASLSEPEKAKIRKREIEAAREKYQEILRDLAAGRSSPDRWAGDRARVEAAFADVPGGRARYRDAVDRIRMQTCMRDRFAAGVERSGAYLPLIEEIFAARKLPRELTRLPFVESLFQLGARSKVAAGGIWQFMPATAAPYLTMRPELDERFDPIRATEAAARLLTENYNALGSWPLAITAYNHGRNGMLRAVRQVGSRDLGEIVRRYESPIFGFASRNFYAEFIAATRVYADRRAHFPGVEPAPRLEFAEFVPKAYVAARELAERGGVELDLLRAMNPAISRDVWEGELFLPAGYRLRVPPDRLAAVERAYATLGEGHRTTVQAGFTYRVRPGDSLLSIAGRYGTSVRRLQQVNGLSDPHRIRVGQTLRIPGSAAPEPSRPAAAAIAAVAAPDPGRPNVHVVAAGDTLTAIAARYRTSVADIMAANALSSAHRLRVGQRLAVPSLAGTTHVVRPGETLGAIARRYGTTVQAIQRSNRIDDHLIKPDQVLVIPCATC